MDENGLANEITAATELVFATMLGMAVSPTAVAVERGVAGVAEGVAALVGMAGAWAGTGCVACSGDFARRIADRMLEERHAAVCDDVLDTMGEIANMVVGNIKTKLEERLGPMGLSIPTVVYGRNFATRSIGKHDWVVVTFEAEGERFTVQMMLSKSDGVPGKVRHGFSPLHRIS